MADEQSRKEINKTIAKPLALTAGILGLLQGIAWIIFSVLCISCYEGSIDIASFTNPSDNEYYKFIYRIFFDAGITLGDVIIKPRDFLIFNCFYLVFSIIWTGASGTIVWAMIHDKWNFSKSTFGTWSVTTILISIVDIVLMGLLVSDYATVNNNYPSEDSFKTQILVSYGIVMSLAARGYVLWIINVVFAVIMTKFTVNVIVRENKGSALPIIHGFETTDNGTPPWFNNNSTKDFWSNPERTTSNTNGGFDNHGFERSQSFFTPPVSNGISNNRPPNNIYNATPNNLYNTTPDNFYNPPSNNSTAPTASPTNQPTSFSEAIAHRTATIGRNKTRRSPLNQVSPPVIPDPDYTPPHSPNGLKGVLRSKSHYNQPVF